MDSLPPKARQIVREVDADIAIRDQKEWARLRSQLALGFGEMLLLSGLFAFGVGIVVTVIFALPYDPARPQLYYFMCLWILGFITWVVICIEFLIRKFRTLRRVVELMDRRLGRIEEAAASRNRPSP